MTIEIITTSTALTVLFHEIPRLLEIVLLFYCKCSSLYLQLYSAGSDRRLFHSQCCVSLSIFDIWSECVARSNIFIDCEFLSFFSNTCVARCVREKIYIKTYRVWSWKQVALNEWQETRVANEKNSLMAILNFNFRRFRWGAEARNN